jgi:hypothetical protein
MLGRTGSTASTVQGVQFRSLGIAAFASPSESRIATGQRMRDGRVPPVKVAETRCAA